MISEINFDVGHELRYGFVFGAQMKCHSDALDVTTHNFDVLEPFGFYAKNMRNICDGYLSYLYSRINSSSSILYNGCTIIMETLVQLN